MKRWLLNFYKTAVLASSRRDYYYDVSKRSLKNGVLYLFSLFVLVTFLQTIFFIVAIIFLLPSVPKYIAEVKKSTGDIYPKDLVIKIQNGTLSMNKSKPYIVKIPELQTVGYTSFITVDPESTAKSYLNKKTLVLFAKSGMYTSDLESSQGKYNFAPYSNQTSINFTYDKFQNYRNDILRFLERLPIFMPLILLLSLIVIPVIGGVFMTVWNLIYLIPVAVIIWISSKVFKVAWSYRDSYIACIYGSTVPVIFMTVFGSLGIQSQLLYTATIMLWMVLVLAKVSEKKTL